MPKVSIIVPVYNVEKYIDKCLSSLVNQTLNDIEIIIVNDGSIDKSEQIILKYKEKYPSKIVYLKKENGGLSDARNFGMPYAKGNYIAFLDSDDYVELDTYEKLYNRAIQTDADMVECDFYWEYSDKKIHDTSANYKDESDMYANARVVAWNKLYKKDLIINSGIKFPKGLRYEDLEFFYKILPQLKKIELINEPLIHYVQRDDSITYVQNEIAAKRAQVSIPTSSWGPFSGNVMQATLSVPDIDLGKSGTHFEVIPVISTDLSYDEADTQMQIYSSILRWESNALDQLTAYYWTEEGTPSSNITVEVVVQ